MRRGVLLAILIASSAGAQRGVIGGTVVRDTLGHGLADAQVFLPGLNRSARSNYAGEFRIDQIPDGRHAIVIRHVGFAPFSDTVTIANGQALDAEFVMTESAVALDSQRVVAKTTQVAPNLEGFYDRQKLGFGHFVVPDEVRKVDNHNFLDFLASKFPGMKIVRFKDGSQFLASGRQACAGPAFSCAGAGGSCLISLYTDGVAEYVSGVTHDQPPDLASYKSEDYAAIEYYSSGATVPTQWKQTSADCGVMLLWRRYR